MRLSAAAWFLAFFLWLPVEDTHIGFVLALAVAAAAWLALRWQPLEWRRGALLGLGVPLFAITLMAFKGGSHGHGFPDFTFRQILSILLLTPVTVLVGAGLGWLWQAFHN